MTKTRRGTMIFEELHNRYGTHIARRVQQELSSSEFAQVAVDRLSTWLGTRAESAHKDYQTILENPFNSDNSGSDYISNLYRRWQQAEELAYVIAIAEDVSTCAHAATGGK